MASGDITIFNDAWDQMFRKSGGINLETDTLKVAILTNAVVPTAADATPALADYTEISQAGNYVSGGFTLTGVTFTAVAGVLELKSTSSVSYAADAAQTDVARWGLLQSSTANLALGFIDLGGSIDMTAVPLNINWPSDVIFSMTQT